MGSRWRGWSQRWGQQGAGHWQQIQVKEEESGSDDKGTERSRAAPVSRLSDHDQGGTGHVGLPFPKRTALPTHSWLNAWTDVQVQFPMLR